MEQQDRIAQWENMTQADPENAMGWFSLGNAYRDAERLEEAQGAFTKAIDLDESFSRAYQLLAQVMVKLGHNDEAGNVATKGYGIAAEQGDVMPQKAMGAILEKLGRPVPEIENAQPEIEVTGDMIMDRRLGKPGPRLPDPPMRGPVGLFIYDHFSQTTWREWIAMGTKVINELRLDFSNEEHQQMYEEHMLEWLGVSREEIDEYARSQGQAQEDAST